MVCYDRLPGASDLFHEQCMAHRIARHSLREHPSMSDYIIDADPFIPSGVPATVEQVTAMVVDGVLPADKVPDLHPNQRPDDIAEAVASAVAYRVADGEKVAKFKKVLDDVKVSAKDIEQVVALRAELPTQDEVL